MTATTAIAPNRKVTNERGAWAILRFDPQGGYANSLGPVGLWYAEVYAADFAAGITSTTLTPSPLRSKAERSIRQWLAAR